MKISKAYILYIDDSKSKSYADECASSCLKYDIDYELHLGYKGLTIEDLAKKTGWSIGREGMEENDRQYVKEYNAAMGHIDIWRKIYESGRAGVVLEHDAIVKANFHDLEVDDGEILHLGPRMDRADDYEFPVGLSTVYLNVRRHEGAHAYAMTPATAKFLLDEIEEEKRLLPTEALVSVRNRYDLTFKDIDPPYVVCAIGDRVSYTHHNQVTDKQNFKHHAGFIAGLKDPSVMNDYRLMDYAFSEDWFSGNIDKWVGLLKEYVDIEAPLKILEIGSYEGRATTWLIDNAMHNPNSEIFCVDTFNGSPEHDPSVKDYLYKRFTFNLSVSKNPEKARIVRADSRIALPSLCRDGHLFDFIYVDGSHATLDVVNDGIYALHLLKRGGIVVFDDYQWIDPIHKNQPVKKAVDFLDANYPNIMVRVLDGYQRAYRKAP